MGVFENNKCLSINGGIIHIYSRLDKGISHDEELELIKLDTIQGNVTIRGLIKGINYLEEEELNG